MVAQRFLRASAQRMFARDDIYDEVAVTHGRAFHPFDPRSATLRIVYATVAGALTWLLFPDVFAPATRMLIAFDVGCFVLMLLALSIIVRSDINETRKRAAAEDPGRTFVWILVIGISAFSLFAATILVHETKNLPHTERLIRLFLSIITVLLSWVMAHISFTLRYAHLYYRGGRDNEGGLDFPGGEKTDTLDFAYFAFTIGMCFQVSDATISNRTVRHTALLHALISFAFNTGIVALAINVVTSQVG